MWAATSMRHGVVLGLNRGGSGQSKVREDAVNRQPSANPSVFSAQQFSESRSRVGRASFALYLLAAGVALMVCAVLILQSLEPYGWVEQFQQAALP
jgi:hypothetical protein